MRIEALAIFFIIDIAAVPMVAADPVSQQEPHLPQFVSPIARADVVQSARGSSNANETRQAAEILSGKFSDAMPRASSAASVATASMADTTGAVVRDDPKMQGRVAVLVAETSPDSARAKKAKISQAKPTAVAKKRAPRRMRVANAGKAKATDHRRSPDAHSIAPPQDAPMLASNEVPGVETGWQTGIIGLLTNPTFWH